MNYYVWFIQYGYIFVSSYGDPERDKMGNLSSQNEFVCVHVLAQVSVPILSRVHSDGGT